MHSRWWWVAGLVALAPLLALEPSGGIWWGSAGEAVASPSTGTHAVQPQPASAVGAETRRYARVRVGVSVPEIELTNARGKTADLTTLLAGDGPVLLQFIFTTCTSICPVMSASFAAVQDRLPPNVRLVSISIDPEHDTPARLRDYRERYGAGRQWSLWTGATGQVRAAQRAFSVDRGNKMRHEPSTFLRGARDSRWVRLDGLPGPTDLLAEIDRGRPPQQHDEAPPH